MSSPWEFAVVTSDSIFVPFFLSLFPLVLAYCYDQQLISNLAFCPSLFSISSSMRQSVHEQSCVVPIMFNAWVGDLFYMRWWLWFFEWSLAASVFGVYTLVIEAGEASMWQWSLCFAPVDMIKLMNHLWVECYDLWTCCLGPKWWELSAAGTEKENCMCQVLLGDMGAGKSSLVLRFVKGQFFDYQVFPLSSPPSLPPCLSISSGLGMAFDTETQSSHVAKISVQFLSLLFWLAF